MYTYVAACVKRASYACPMDKFQAKFETVMRYTVFRRSGEGWIDVGDRKNGDIAKIFERAGTRP